MPTYCSIIQCGARKNTNQSHLTMHRFPRNEVLRQKWLEVIGVENIKPGVKVPRICSLHFTESSFNKTLYVIRLRDDAVPSIDLVLKSEPLSDDEEDPLNTGTPEAISHSQEKEDKSSLSGLSHSPAQMTDVPGPGTELELNRQIEHMAIELAEKTTQIHRFQRANSRLRNIIHKCKQKILNMSKIPLDVVDSEAVSIQRTNILLRKKVINLKKLLREQQKKGVESK